MQRPKPEETLPYYHHYIANVQNGNIVNILKENHEVTQQMIQNIPTEKANYRYADGKWSVKEVLLHLVDVERVMSYRALRFGRNDKTDIPGFDHDNYVPNSDAENRTIADIAVEFQAVRNATIEQFKHYNSKIMDRIGTANNGVCSVRGLAYIIAGHELHHRRILKERYL
ncbi:MAG: DinB family protein [Saprospiraceae bacterium]